MGIADTDLDTEPDATTDDTGKPPKKKRPCLACHERESGFGQLGNYCKECRDAGVGKKAPPEEPARPARKKPNPRSNVGKMQAKLAESHFGMSCMIVLATNMQAMGSPAVVDMLEARSNDWASATAALAEEDERVAEVLDRLLRGGVWAGFLMQTVGSIITLGVVSGKARVPYGAIRFLAPDLIPFMQDQPQTAPAGVA